MMPKLVCSLIRHNQLKNGHTPLCKQLWEENQFLKREVQRLLNHIQELKTGKPWWKWW